MPSPETMTANRSTLSLPVRAGKIFPSQCTVRGPDGPSKQNDSLTMQAVAVRFCLHAFLTDSLFSANSDGSWPSDLATAATMKVAFLSETFVLSNAEATAGL